MIDKLKRAITLIIILAAIAIGAVIWLRVSQFSLETQGMALGLLGGCALGLVPLGILSAFALIIARTYMQTRQTRQHYNQPPVVVVTPNGQIGNPYPPQQYYPQNDWPRALPFGQPQRQFKTIGEEPSQQ